MFTSKNDINATRPRAAVVARAGAMPVAKADAKPVAIAASVFAIGATLVLIAGFADTAAVHDAAHDTRHSLAFPCH